MHRLNFLKFSDKWKNHSFFICLLGVIFLVLINLFDLQDEEANKQKNLVNSFKFVFNTETRRGGRGRGPRERRGGGRGGRGGRGDRRGGPRESAPKFDDENDFPSLVKTEA